MIYPDSSTDMVDVLRNHTAPLVPSGCGHLDSVQTYNYVWTELLIATAMNRGLFWAVTPCRHPDKTSKVCSMPVAWFLLGLHFNPACCPKMSRADRNQNKIFLTHQIKYKQNSIMLSRISIHPRQKQERNLHANKLGENVKMLYLKYRIC
jgi:hypothetical protein